MSRAALPAAALTPADVPPPDASLADVLAFAALTDVEAPDSLKARWETDGPDGLSTRELWGILSLQARNGRHGEGPDDALVGEMRAVVAAIGRRVAARGTGVSIWRGDITRLRVGAIVNAANERMLGGGGVDGAIHRAAGPALREACEAVLEVRPGVRCPTGEARITPGFRLPAAHVIHTVGPVWRGGDASEEERLASAYRSSLALADTHGIDAVAFPALSTGVYGFPADHAARIAVGTVRRWQAARGRPARVLLVAYDVAAERALGAALAD